MTFKYFGNFVSCINPFREIAKKHASNSPSYPSMLKVLKWVFDFKGYSGLIITLFIVIPVASIFLACIWIALIEKPSMYSILMLMVACIVLAIILNIIKQLVEKMNKSLAEWEDMSRMQFGIERSIIEAYISKDLLVKQEIGSVDLETAIEISLLRRNEFNHRKINMPLDKILQSPKQKLDAGLIDEKSYSELRKLYSTLLTEHKRACQT